MAVIEEALRALVLADGTVSGLVGSRYYPLVLPKNVVLPAVVCSRVSGPRVHSQDGASGLASPRFQWACLARSYEAAKGLANALRAAVDGYKGAVSGVTIGGVFVQNEIDYFNEQTAEAQSAFVVYVDAVVWHGE